eukprot:CAMPEP_0116834446 /NCGR_PEP_ID=MMETSP0418-20121206/6996_1 /TAXON_ID=1158023 /ORGANISM="Astrosyne radiata, Strain 13vi08-1A" /LENGTH=226 /DNA_ID=CAMNT_0004464007 /DNA_START=118 /DNA_END=798 /DNA_ORIENTATION=-
MVEIQNGNRENARAWFLYSATDPADATLSQSGIPMTYIGLEESLQRVENVLDATTCCARDHQDDHDDNDNDCFVGIFGFSQGAVFCHLLAGLVEEEQKKKRSSPTATTTTTTTTTTIQEKWGRIRCAILVGGFPAMHSDNDGSSPSLEDLTLPSLHIMGRADTSVLATQSLKLASRFHDPQLFHHANGHVIPQFCASFTEVLRFVEEVRNQKKEEQNRVTSTDKSL